MIDYVDIIRLTIIAVCSNILRVISIYDMLPQELANYTYIGYIVSLISLLIVTILLIYSSVSRVKLIETRISVIRGILEEFEPTVHLDKSPSIVTLATLAAYIKQDMSRFIICVLYSSLSVGIYFSIEYGIDALIMGNPGKISLWLLIVGITSIELLEVISGIKRFEKFKKYIDDCESTLIDK